MGILCYLMAAGLVGALLPDKRVSARVGEVFCLCLCIGRGISVGWCCISAIHGSSIYTVRYMAWYIIALTNAGKERVRRYIGKMVNLLADACNYAYRGIYAIVEPVYGV